MDFQIVGKFSGKLAMTSLHEIEQAVQDLSADELAAFRDWFAAFNAVPSYAGKPPETVQARFRCLAKEWEDAVAHHSSWTVRHHHPAYRKIIGLGPEVVPFLLRDMEDYHKHWFVALREITGADPVPESAAGNIPKIVQAWLQWAREKGYQW
jgi:hypothetical protein